MKPPQMNIFVLDRFISWGPRFGPGTETKITKNSALGRILLCSPSAFHVPSRTGFNGSFSESLWLVTWEIHRKFLLGTGLPRRIFGTHRHAWTRHAVWRLRTWYITTQEVQALLEVSTIYSSIMYQNPTKTDPLGMICSTHWINCVYHINPV